MSFRQNPSRTGVAVMPLSPPHDQLGRGGISTRGERSEERPSPDVLTEEQEAIVAHSHGPALVFAVAGSGKTTAMIHRIRRLIDDEIASPRAILATSFGATTVRDIQRMLADAPRCREVGVCTLHSIGLQALKAAHSLGYFDYRQPAEVDFEQAPKVLFSRALKRARSLGVSFARELDNVDRDDFLDYVSACKGKLQYPELEAAGLPETALGVASQAPPMNTIPWYLDLYRLYEGERQQTGLTTFDDMLMIGWEMLFRYPRVRADVSGRYQFVMVDEFQDVNLAQSEILDLITSPHRNYMVIGDEDQTIFEWRGASPRFILEFANRYGAAKYNISDNFRCHASQVALANRVIAQNSIREPKRVQLTKGFEGNTFVVPGTSEALSSYVASEIRAEQSKGRQLSDMAVLVRKYAQTPVIEQALAGEEIPYRIIGSQPFYQRSEIAVLLNYLRLAPHEQKLRAGQRLSSEETRRLRDAWMSVYNTPTRYFQREAAEDVLKESVYRGVSLSSALSLNNPGRSSTATARIDRLANTLEWLGSTSVEEPAHSVLAELVLRIGYREHLLSSSGFAEVGESRFANVEAFLAYSKSKGSRDELLAHIDVINRRYRVAADDEEQADYLRVMSIHRSKGLQWPVVFIADCNDGILPPKKCDNVEEECRLLYVAITRTMHTLHLLVNEELRVSPFLDAAHYRETLEEVRAAASVLTADPDQMSDSDLARARQHILRLGLERYVRLWWNAPGEHKRRLLQPTPVEAPPVKSAVPTPSTARRTDTPPPPGKGTEAWGGRRVRHPVLGLGTVVDGHGKGGQGTVTVRFDRAGEKRFVLPMAELSAVVQTQAREAPQVLGNESATAVATIPLDGRARKLQSSQTADVEGAGGRKSPTSSAIRFCRKCGTNRKFSNGQCSGCVAERERVSALRVAPREKKDPRTEGRCCCGGARDHDPHKHCCGDHLDYLEAMGGFG